jgi:type IV secretion system protein VirB9
MKRQRAPAPFARWFCHSVLVTVLLHGAEARAEAMPVGGDLDSRIRVAVFQVGQVYRLHGYVGYQIDLEFEPGETFVGLGAGDIEGLSFVAQDNHLFLKPKAARVATNLTVLTSRRQYQFDYTSAPHGPDLNDRNVIYALRFVYPAVLSQSARDAAAARIEAQLREAASGRPGNLDYWYCGDPSIRPVAASDDGVHTRLRFGAHAELPAIFVGNDDGSESLLNFSMDGGDVIVHRVARRFIVRRGKLTGCIVNKGYAGGGTRLDSGTIVPEVERTTPGSSP